MAEHYLMFCLFGGTAVVVNMATPWLLTSASALGWDLSLCKALAAELALLNDFPPE